MAEEIIQRDIISKSETIGGWNLYNIGSTTLRQLKQAGIIPKRDYGEHEGKKPDALLTDGKTVVAAIEFKDPRNFNSDTKIENAVSQELEVCRVLKCPLYIVTDGVSKTVWINVRSGNPIVDCDGKPLSNVFNPNRCKDESAKLISDILDSIDEKTDAILYRGPVDPLPLAKQVWQDLWAVSGATPENCLYTFVEIFTFKYLSDLGTLQGLHSFNNLLRQYDEGSDEDVLEYYASQVRKKIKDVFPRNPRDNTTIINGTIFVSKDDRAVKGYATVFRRILERFDAFGTLKNIDYDFKSRLFETFLKESISKKNWGQFFTPLKVVRAIVGMADIHQNMSICDPACGVGKFLLEPILRDLSKYYEIRDGKLIPHIELVGFDKGFDHDEQKTIILAKANMLIYMSPLIQSNPALSGQFADLFNKTFVLQTNSILGTLASPEEDRYDLILTNPPYVVEGSSNLKEEIGKVEELKQYYSVNSIGIEGLFIQWIIHALKPGGKAFIVVPDGLFNRSHDDRLREHILDECVVEGIISLPLNTFFTTNKKTYILIIAKKIPEQSRGYRTKASQTAPVFTYLCSEIGETRDNYRFPMERNDLAVAAALYNTFKHDPSAFKTDDPRCKVAAVDRLRGADTWCVDRWWTAEEKRSLGITDAVRKMTISEYTSYLGEISDTIRNYMEPLSELGKSIRDHGEDEKRDVPLSDSAFFDFIVRTIGKNRTELQSVDTGNPSDIPVYSASKGPIAHVKRLEDKTPINASPESLVLSFATNGDGSAGRNFVIHDRPFYINADRICLVSKNPDVSIRYVRYALSDMKDRYEFNHANKANHANVSSKVVVSIPFRQGAPDLRLQGLLADYMECREEVSTVSEELSSELLSLSLSSVLSVPSRSKIVRLAEIAELERGKSRYTKSYGQSNPGPYPVYSASNRSPLTSINSYDYDGRYLSWSTNGFAGQLTIIEGKFSINGDRGLVKQTVCPPIEPNYLRFALEPEFRSLAKGRRGDNGQNEFTKLYPGMIEGVEVALPAREDGSIDYTAIGLIAKRYVYLEQCRDDINRLLYELTSVEIRM